MKDGQLFFKEENGEYTPIGKIENVEMTEPENPFGIPYSLGIDLLSKAFADVELSAYLTAKEIRKLTKALGIKKKYAADLRRRKSAKRYRMRKLEKRMCKQKKGELKK